MRSSMTRQSSIPQHIKLNLVLEQAKDGRSVASVLELPNYHIEAATDDLAVSELLRVLTDRFAQARILPLEITLPSQVQPENPWVKYAGLFKDDPYFAKIADRLQAERQSDGDDLDWYQTMSLWVLDTDHVSLFLRGDPHVRDHILQVSADVAITIITVQEVFNGWITEINDPSQAAHLVDLYTRLWLALD